MPQDGDSARKENSSEKPMGAFLDPIQLSGHNLKHRLVMAPMTRFRANSAGIVNPLAAEYYSQRATAGGLLISEGLVPCKRGQGFPNSPGIWNQEQVDAWKPITAAVKAKGGVFFAQLWHIGRVTVPSQTGGYPGLSSTKIPLPGNHPLLGSEATEPYVEGEAMSKLQIKETIRQFVHAAKNAISAGFDGIEIHAGNGYLFDTFVHSNINDRTDEYGGCLANRLRFPLEVVDAVSAAIGSKKTAIRIAPYYTLQQAGDVNRIETFSAYSAELESRSLAYVHMVEPRYDQLSTGGAFGAQRQNGLATNSNTGTETGSSTLWPFRQILKTTVLIAAGGYTPESAREAITEGRVDLVAFGRYYTSNPDLVWRVLNQQDITPYDRKTFYTSDIIGYLGWPKHKDNVESLCSI